MTRTLFFLLFAAAAGIGCADPDTNYYTIETPQGSMVIRLYDETPLHRDNFKKLAAEQFYDGTLFHRTIQNFMIQGGDPNSKDENPESNGLGGPGYRVPAEFDSTLFHKRGALAAARDGNPERASSGSQFYIVHGRVYSDEELTAFEQQKSQATGTRFRIPAAQRALYTTVGGVPWLDGDYTVFGELVEGFEVLDAIAASETPNLRGEATSPALGDQPTVPIPMTIRPASR
jgi:cyclophilin family peptidyl-prolyl cis-trans isomerase